MSAVASFNDSRCAGQMVCPNDSLLFTCTITGSPFGLAQLTLPSGVGVQVTITNMTEVGAPLPDGVTVQSHDAIVDGGLVNYTLTLAIDRASLLGGNATICTALSVSPSTDEASCPIATGITAFQCDTRPTIEHYTSLQTHQGHQSLWVRLYQPTLRHRQWCSGSLQP